MALRGKSQSKCRSGESMKGSRAIIICQHILLWTTLFVLAVTLYVFAEGAVTVDTLPAEASLLFCAIISLLYLVLHNVAAFSRNRSHMGSQNKRKCTVQWVAKMVLRFAITIWMLGCAVVIILTIAKHPLCTTSDVELDASLIDIGLTCVLQRVSVGASLLCLCISTALFVLLLKVSEPFRSYLFGTVKDSGLLPLALPYRSSKQPFYSEISFKCRTSTSLESDKLSLSTTRLPPKAILPTHSDDGIGLGIYASQPQRQSMSRFLTPRPSLQSIRSSTSIMRPPPLEPLPPLPAYLPSKYKRTPGAIMTAVHPPRRPYRPEFSTSERSLRLVPSSPTQGLSMTQFAQKVESSPSLSSIYSRHVSGDRAESEVLRPGMLSISGRSASSESTLTVMKSPLAVVRSVDEDCSGGSVDVDIDDAASLQAALPAPSSSHGFEQVQTVGGIVGSLRYFDRTDGSRVASR